MVVPFGNIFRNRIGLFKGIAKNMLVSRHCDCQQCPGQFQHTIKIDKDVTRRSLTSVAEASTMSCRQCETSENFINSTDESVDQELNKTSSDLYKNGSFEIQNITNRTQHALVTSNSVNIGAEKACILYDVPSSFGLSHWEKNGESSGEVSLVELACSALECNELIAVPTDTVYGIAALAQSTEAVNKIYHMKRRDVGKPISICVGEIDDVYKWGRVTISRELLSRLLPGPVTVVLERTPQLNPDLNPGTNLVGIRIPDYPFVVQIVKKCCGPLALTSANLSSQPSTLAVEEFSHLFPQIAVVFDGGHLGDSPILRQGSTVVDLSLAGLFKIIRPGSARDETVTLLEQCGLKNRDR